MTKPRWVARVLAVALTVPVIAGLGVTTAAADNPDCTSTYACWWVDTNYSGTSYGSTMNQSSWPEGIVNKDSSAQNAGTSGNAIFTYNYAYQVEVMYCLRRGVAVNAILPAKADRGGSHAWKTADSGCY